MPLTLPSPQRGEGYGCPAAEMRAIVGLKPIERGVES
jgi:hypothetical protein